MSLPKNKVWGLPTGYLSEYEVNGLLINFTPRATQYQPATVLDHVYGVF